MSRTSDISKTVLRMRRQILVGIDNCYFGGGRYFRVVRRTVEELVARTISVGQVLVTD